jgi:hypothetical protein
VAQTAHEERVVVAKSDRVYLLNGHGVRVVAAPSGEDIGTIGAP